MRFYSIARAFVRLLLLRCIFGIARDRERDAAGRPLGSVGAIEDSHNFTLRGQGVGGRYLRRNNRLVTQSAARTEVGNLDRYFKNHLRKAGAALLVGIGLYLLLSLFSYHTSDPSWANTQSGADVRNLGGQAGAWIAYSLYFIAGYVASLLPFVLFAVVFHASRHRDEHVVVHLTQAAGYLIALVSLGGLVSMNFTAGMMPASAGGRLGELTAQGFIGVFGPVGATLLMLAILIGGVHLVSALSWLKVMDATGAAVLAVCGFIMKWMHDFKSRRSGTREVSSKRGQGRKKTKLHRKAPRIEPRICAIPTSDRVEKEKQPSLFIGGVGGDQAELPPLGSLDKASSQGRELSEKAINVIARHIEMKLADFDVEAEVVGARSGPVITRFELVPAPGTKASRITSLEKDLARALSMPSVRVVEVIPGKSAVGLEVPNEAREKVLLKDILSSEVYEKATSPLTLGLGKDISGSPVLVDLERMPHLLIAGTTGSGKSVAVHSMLMSILFKASPQQVRLILIDPKMLELNTYDGIPHLLTPVITDMKRAASTLNWLVAEMEQRYRLMSSLSVRNIGGYNRKIAQAVHANKPLSDPLQEGDDAGMPLEEMPYIVVVIDEFADMMMVVGKRVEELIARLAQKARAAGIHLLLATQRPSVDVITGLIKANIPARIAFQVSSKVDSRTILDQGGAEQLLGHGDMLYVSPGTSLAERVHGAFVSDQEVHKVTAFLKAKGEPHYIDLEDTSNVASRYGNKSEPDPLYDQAVAVVVESRKTSISYIQRRFRIGYNRAARMIEEMEVAGVVSPVQANGTREVLVPSQP